MDTADFISKLRRQRFSQDCWLVSADVVEFYPNTDPAEGDGVILDHIPPELVQLCLSVAKLIH